MTENNYLLDTSILIDYLHDRPKAVVFIENLKNAKTSVITQAELLEGSRNKKEMTSIEETINHFSIVYPSLQICRLAISFLKNYCLQYGLLFDDATIAATAIENNLTLATTEKKHFKPIKNLQLHHPY